jgi:hypothetical protein
MKLEWLASVLRPSDIVARAGSGNPDYASRPHVVLAAAIDGDPWPTPPIFPEGRPTESYDSEEVAAVDLAVKTFFADTQRVAATNLVERLLGENLDLAATCALSLVAATALADLEDRPMFERLLTSVLERVKAKDPSTRLLRATLLQQLSLRNQDWGSRDTALSEEANVLINSITDAQFPNFEISPTAIGDSNTTIGHIIAALRYATLSILPNSMSITKSSHAPIDVTELVAAAKSSQEFLVAHWDRASEYARFVEAYFNRLYGDRSARIGGTDPDLFYVNLRNELYGSDSVYATRRQLALLRMVEVSSISAQHDQAECLRLLRYGQGDKHLALALNRLRLGGPLTSLSQDARQVIARRLTPGYVRSEDLQVVEAAADLLTESEARDALAAIFRLLEAGSPTNDPDRWSAPHSRIDRTWRAAASLAASANSVSEVSARLLRDVRSSRYDETLDMAYSRVLMRLEWERITEPQIADWRDWIGSGPSQWRYTADTARSMLGVPLTMDDTDAVRKSDVEAVVSDLLRDHLVSQEIKGESADVTAEAMSSIRSSAQQGRYASGGAEPAELAVVLITFGEARLWEPLAEFVLDAAVPRQHKTGALDRLANARPPIPLSVADTLRMRADDLLLMRDASPFDRDPLRPYPAALRMLAAYDLILDEDLVTWLSELGGSQAPGARIEAAKTISQVSPARGNSWLLTMAVQLSYETDAEVQGYASSAIATMVSFPSEARGAAIRRLLTLMESDSLIAPLLAIRGLAKEPTAIDSQLRSGVERLVSRHPSRRVRTEAADLIRASSGHMPA